MEISNKIKDTFSNKPKETTIISDRDQPVTMANCVAVCGNNAVNENKLHNVQQETLKFLRECLAKTYGPMGSYSIILKGNDPQTISAEYSKDGMKVLKHIIFDSPIEMSIQSEILEVASYVESKVGDATTSAVIISSLIFDEMYQLIQKNPNVPPRIIVESFKHIVELAKKFISLQKKDISLDDIYNICMISTNGNKEVSNNVLTLYKEFGFDVNIDVVISNDENTKIKKYDGLTIEEGYSDPAYINNPITGTADIHNAKIYAFQDPIDTPEMVSFLEKIIYDNILEPTAEGEDATPTVIIAPKISRDASGILTKLVSLLYRYDESKSQMQKPPISIITNISGIDEIIYKDIAMLCNCKFVRKYIDFAIQKADQEKGDAPTLETIHEFAGSAELVSSDSNKTKFINPIGMVNGSGVYESMLNFLRAEIDNAISSNDDKLVIGRLKKRLRCLEANMIEFMVGGISVSDRDSVRDLVEDAVKNCASAAEYGVGRAANFEGLFAFCKMLEQTSENGEGTDKDGIESQIVDIIAKAYYKAASILYGTVLPKDKVDDVILQSIKNEMPFDVMDLFHNTELPVADFRPGNNVICSIRTDIEVLDAISKIVTIMVTSNQCLLQSTLINRY